MPISAKEYREDLRKEMLEGVVPPAVIEAVKQYTALRDDPCWRSTAFVECLGEAALMWLDSVNKDKSALPPMVYEFKSAADSVAYAYQMEEAVDWVVLCKLDHASIKSFKPCRTKDYTNDVKREGWWIAMED